MVRRLRRAGTGSVPCLAVLALAAPASAFEPDLQPAFTYGGTGCVEPGVTVSVPVERARAFVPEPFVPTSLSGDRASADVALLVARCETLNVDGRTVPGRTVVDAGVIISSPDGSEGPHVYQLWQLAEAPAIAEKMAGVGVRGGRVDGLTVEDAGAGPIERATANVPWAPSTYELGIEAAVPGTASAATTWWHRGPSGFVRLGYRFPRSSVRTGTGRVTARAGSPLAQLLGGTSVDGSGSVTRLDFAGRVTAERSPGSSPSAPAPSEPTAPGTAPAPSRQRTLRVVVQPARVRAGRRVRLVVRVTSGGRAVRRALVRVGRRSARTDARGRARLTVRLRAGGHRVSASRTGHRAGAVRLIATR